MKKLHMLIKNNHKNKENFRNNIPFTNTEKRICHKEIICRAKKTLNFYFEVLKIYNQIFSFLF